jgi:hypothetical protein
MGQLLQVSWIAGQQHYRSRLSQCHDREQCVKRTPVPGQSRPAEQFAGSPAKGSIDPDHFDILEDSVYLRVALPSSQHLGQR